MFDSAAVNVSDVRGQLGALIDRACSSHQPVYIARRGRRVAAIIDAEDLDRLIDLAEDMEDIRAAQQAREELRATSATAIPWEDVKADLGLT